MELNLKTSITTVIEYSISLLIVLNCNSVFSQLVYKDYKFPEWIVILTLLLLVFLLSQDKLKAEIDYKLILFVLLFWLYLFVFIVCRVSSNRLLEFVAKFIVFIPVMTLCIYLYRKRGIPYRIFYRITDIVIVIAIISLFFWSLGSILDIINPTGKVLYQWGSQRYINSFLNLYFETQTISFMGFTGIRNTGIFTEAPMFSLCLSISLIIELFMKNRVNKKRVILLLITQLTTLSTTGWVLSIIMLIMKFIFLNNKRKSIYLTLLKWILIPAGLVVAAYSVSLILNEKANSYSFSVRMDDYIAGFKAWMDYPIMGNGYGASYSIEKYMRGFGRDNFGFSNSVMSVLAQGGLYLFCVYFLPIIFFLREYFKKTNINLFACGVAILFLFITTIFQSTFILLLFLSLGYSLLFNKGSETSEEDYIKFEIKEL